MNENNAESNSTSPAHILIFRSIVMLLCHNNKNLWQLRHACTGRLGQGLRERGMRGIALLSVVVNSSNPRALLSVYITVCSTEVQVTHGALDSMLKLYICLQA